MLRSFSDTTPRQPVNFVDFVTITNLASGGVIGTAAATVDQYMGAYISQTTSSQTLTLPSPTGDDPKFFWIVNTGSVSFTINQKVVFPGTSLMFLYSAISIPNIGKTWVAGGVSATLTTTTSTTTP